MGRKASLFPSRAALYLPEVLAHQAVLYQQLRLERPVHRAHVGDLKEPAALLLLQEALQLYLALDTVDPTLPRLAPLAVCGVYPLLGEIESGVPRRPLPRARANRESNPGTSRRVARGL